MSTAQSARATARRAADHPMLDRLARVGLACRGVLYALIGVLAIQIALGGGAGEQADKGGAITTVAGAGRRGVVMVAGFAALGRCGRPPRRSSATRRSSTGSRRPPGPSCTC